jgi:hypothetical protein
VEVVAGIGGPPQAELFRQVPENEDGGLPGHALGRAEDVLVGHEVTEHEDPPVLEPAHDTEELGRLEARHGRVGARGREIGPCQLALPTCISSASLY